MGSVQGTEGAMWVCSRFDEWRGGHVRTVKRSHRRPILSLLFYLLWLGGVLLCSGCYSSLHETYYLVAEDPATHVTNFFRIRLDGQTTLSRAKYSVGFYDRDAVEKLFGETSLAK